MIFPLLLAYFLTRTSYRPREYETDDGPWDPISGGASALLGTIASLGMGVADFPIEIFRKINKTKEAHKASKEAATESSSGSDTPVSSVQSRSQVNSNDRPSSEASSSVKTSYEETERSSAETPNSNDTSLSSAISFASSDPGSIKGNSLKQALRGTLSRSRSASRERLPGSRTCSPIGQKEVDHPSKLTLENAMGAGKGVSRIVGAGIKSPMDFTLGIARGFHNAPKLYGDDTVRPQEKVTDFQSGLKAAGKVWDNPSLHFEKILTKW